MQREEFDWLPRGPRKPAKLAAVAEWPDGSCLPAVVSNLSYQGCQLTAGHQFVRGETVRLTLPNMGRIQAQIRWVRGERAGAKFLTGESARDARRARIGV